jgi:hypothetical protein
MKNYYDNMAIMSLSLANLYKNYIESESDKDYEAYNIYVSKTGIPSEKLDKIETIVIKNKNFRPIDIYQFW